MAKENLDDNKLENEKEDNKEMIGLVLSGGGGKGAYQAGVLKALAEAGVLKDVTAISGASIGAVNAVIYAMGHPELLEKIWDDIDMDVVFDFDLKMLKENRPFFSRDEMNRLFDTYIDQKVIKKSPYDIYFSMTDITEEPYKVKYIKVDNASDENLKKYLMASTALPVIYEPILINDRKYRDGGICDNNPIEPLYKKGIRKFIIISLNHGKTVDTSAYTDAEFTKISPSHDLGDLLTGTLNFLDDDKKIKFLLGVKDGERALKTKFEKDPVYIEMEKTIALNDYNFIINTYNQEKRMNELSKSVSDNLDYFNKIADKYKDI